MFDTLIVGVIVLGAALFVGRYLYNQFTAKANACGCSGCGQAGSCGSIQSSPETPGECNGQ